MVACQRSRGEQRGRGRGRGRGSSRGRLASTARDSLATHKKKVYKERRIRKRLHHAREQAVRELDQQHGRGGAGAILREVLASSSQASVPDVDGAGDDEKQAPSSAHERPDKRYDPLGAARSSFKAKRRELEEARKEEERQRAERERQVNARKQERKEKRRQLQYQRTKRGQPVMKHVVQDILAKVRRDSQQPDPEAPDVPQKPSPREQ